MKLQQLNSKQLANAKLIKQALIDIGLTNNFLVAGILAVVSKESGFVVVSEKSYATTSNARIIQVFGAARFAGMNISELKKNSEAFFNVVYNRKDLGNTQPGDGWKYRGRGFNQLTGRVNYVNIGKLIEVDLENNPDLLNNAEIAAKALATFFRSSIISGQNAGLFKQRYGIDRTAEIKDIIQGATIAHQANMGWGKVPAQDPTGGFQITFADAPSYLELN